MSKLLGSIQFSIPDSRLGFPLASVEKKETIFRNYRLGDVISQEGGTCVDAACRGLLWAEPISQNPCKPLEIYKAARKLANTPDHIEGAQLNTAVDYLISKGVVKKDYWTKDAEEIGIFLNTVAPVVCSLPWYERMCETEKDGRIIIKGGAIGFHAVLAFRFDGLKERVWLRNSWGNWGLNGNCYVTMNDMKKLMNQGGLACALVE
jgi:hypothetical protein